MKLCHIFERLMVLAALFKVVKNASSIKVKLFKTMNRSLALAAGCVLKFLAHFSKNCLLI